MEGNEGAGGGRYACPICGIDPEVEAACEHLFCHGDDLPTMALAEAAGCRDVLMEIEELDEEAVPYSASDFLTMHEAALPSFESSICWEHSGALSGVYSVVWAKDARDLASEIRSVLEAKLMDKANRELNRGTE